MGDSDLQAQIDAAKAYEEFFVPALFGQWASRVADAAHIRTGNHVLDVACGTGVLAREVASRVGSSGFVAGVDASPAMLGSSKPCATSEGAGFTSNSQDLVQAELCALDGTRCKPRLHGRQDAGASRGGARTPRGVDPTT